MIQIKNVTCEWMENPVAVSTAQPVFAWNLESDQKNQFQKSWEIIVSDESGRQVWNSGKQEGADTTGIVYAGSPLESCSKYWYQISVESTSGDQAVSKGHFFETAFFSHKEWKAHWIEPAPLPQLSQNPLQQARNEWQSIVERMMRGEQVEMRLEGDILESLPLEPYDPAACMRKHFSCKKLIKRARLSVTAHGIYDVRINGHQVSDTLLNPGFTTYEKRLKYQIYDVTVLLDSENAIAVTVADGWYKGKIALGRGCEYGEVPGLLLQLDIWYQDGERESICSDKSWCWTYNGPVRSADLFLGENYDARLEDGDPSLVCYDTAEWEKVVEQGLPGQTIEPDQQPPVRILEEIPAKKVWTAPNGDILADFGQNLAGVIRAEIQGEQGEMITFEHGEVLDSKGNFYYVFSDTNKAQKDTYICKGEDTEIYQPRFTYHGFRYVRITGGKKWEKEQLTACVIGTDNPDTGSFFCSDSSLNQLQHNIYWSQRSNNITIPTDCPTREKAGWTGDVVVYGATALFNQDMMAFYKDWLKSIRVEQRADGQILGTVPQIKNYVQQAAAGSLGWGDVIITLPWQLYERYGDKRILEENYEAMNLWMKAMKQAAFELPNAWNVTGQQTVFPEKMEGRQLDNQHYLINTGFHFGDWIIPSVVNEQGFSDGPASAFLTMNYADTSLLASIADLFAKISGLLGNSENEIEYTKYAKRVREAFTEEYLLENRCLGQEMQGNYILALKYHMVPDDIALGFARRLNELIEENGYRLDTGFMSTPHLLDVLCDYGYKETAWKVLFQKECPSWLFEVEHGATTLWENWDAIRPDGQIHNCSFNHYAFGCVGDFLYRRVLGIQNNGDGYSKILFAPEYDCPLQNVEGVYQSVRGEIAFSWMKTEEGICISGRVPANTTAVLCLPDGTMKELGNGKFSLTA